MRSERRVRERAVPVVCVVRTGAGRCGAGGPGNHVDVAARWLEQRGCHIDVAGCGRAGEAGAGPVRPTGP